MHLHILGICGTFMGSLAVIAKELGYTVSGSDKNSYPPMSTQLDAQGISVLAPGALAEGLVKADLVLVGNALSRGNPDVEFMLNEGITYASGPEWLFHAVLRDKWVLAVAGTHGKTTTSSILAWILECAGLAPGFLIGGLPLNFGSSARLTKGDYFVVEADEYDTAFFDKRSKFLHYHPRTLILNNLEYDHADIFPDLAAIEKQFHELVRMIPSKGKIIVNAADQNLSRVLNNGCWSERVSFGSNFAQWQAELLSLNGANFALKDPKGESIEIQWSLLGQHNVLNALAACAAASQIGVSLEIMQKALSSFQSVERRLALCGKVNNIKVYDDFAHHPTAIQTTIAALAANDPKSRIIAIVDLGSNSMKKGTHQDTLGPALAAAAQVFIYAPEALNWDINKVTKHHLQAFVFNSVAALIESLIEVVSAGDSLLAMSNGAFDGIHGKLLIALESNKEAKVF
jgi:UDP-N-acetylmuramate: L-alanyl-gamma-D-glutamyl-meso-diaminopimelate ligase